MKRFAFAVFLGSAVAVIAHVVSRKIWGNSSTDFGTVFGGLMMTVQAYIYYPHWKKKTVGASV